LSELRWVVGTTLAIEYRWAEARNDRFAQLAAEFVRLKVDAIVTAGTPSVLALMQATSSIPIVFVAVGDPLNRQLSGWNLPPPMIRAFGAHCQYATLQVWFEMKAAAN